MHQNGTAQTHPAALVSSAQVAASSHQTPRSVLPRVSRRRQALLWGIGSTVLSGLGLIALCLFEQYNGMLSEMRADLKHFNETVGEYAKKDRVAALREAVRQCSSEMTASKLQREQLEQELKVSQTQRALLEKELQQLRERLAYVEGMRAAVLRTVSAKASLPDRRDAPADELRATGAATPLEDK
jgi:septal ring factor EnvC (AmiA/AmiB activator)